jgi:hypothetical protein
VFRNRVELSLPSHRIHAGATVAVYPPGGRRRRFQLPADVRPGMTVVLPADDDDDEVEVVIVPLHRDGRARDRSTEVATAGW